MTDPQRFTLALEEGRRGLDQQMGDLEAIRNRAVGVLGIGGLAASFIGGLTTDSNDSGLGLSSWVSALAFCGVAGLCTAILWPRKLHAAQDPAALVLWADSGAGRDDMDRNLALYMGRQFEENNGTIRLLMWLYTAALFVLLIEVSALIFELRSV